MARRLCWVLRRRGAANRTCTGEPRPGRQNDPGRLGRFSCGHKDWPACGVGHRCIGPSWWTLLLLCREAVAVLRG